MFGQMWETLRRPSGDMTWTQLAAATIFVGVVALAWRQVVLMVMDEI
jgi:hypothetical protein